MRPRGRPVWPWRVQEDEVKALELLRERCEGRGGGLERG